MIRSLAREGAAIDIVGSMAKETGKSRALALGFLLALIGCAAEAPEGRSRAGPGNIMGATLAGASEVPPSSSTGHGEALVSYDTASHQVSWVVRYSALDAPLTAAHFHGPAVSGQNAAPV